MSLYISGVVKDINKLHNIFNVKLYKDVHIVLQTSKDNKYICSITYENVKSWHTTQSILSVLDDIINLNDVCFKS